MPGGGARLYPESLRSPSGARVRADALSGERNSRRELMVFKGSR